MTRVRFYTQVTHPPSLIASLSEKALAQQHFVTVYAHDEAHAKQISDFLWQLPAPSFIAHAMANEPHSKRSALQLAWQTDHIQQDDILLNCQAQQPLFFGQFKHVFEIVSTDPNDMVAGRQRYAFYRDRGYPIKHINQQEHMSETQTQGEDHDHA